MIRYIYLLGLFTCIACVSSPTTEQNSSNNSSDSPCDTVFIHQLSSQERTVLSAIPSALTLSYESKTTSELEGQQFRGLHTWLNLFRKNEKIATIPDEYLHQNIILKLHCTGSSEPYIRICKERMDRVEKVIHAILGQSNSELPLYQTVKHITWGSDSSNTVTVSIHLLHSSS